MSELKCGVCGEPIEEDEYRHVLDDGTVVCGSCIDDYEECCECGKLVPADDTVFWGDERLCLDCLEDMFPTFDEKEVEEETTEAYETMKEQFIGEKTEGLKEGENCLEYDTEFRGAELRYEMIVTVGKRGVITDISRLSAQMMLSEAITSSEWRPYPVDEDDYTWMPEEMLEDYLTYEDEEDDEDGEE